MKTIAITLSLILISAFSIAQENPNQTKIDKAFYQSFANQSNEIEPVIHELKKDQEANAYWIAYGLFNSSIYYMQMEQEDKAEEVADEAIELLEDIKDKTSEEHALLGQILGYSITFSPASAIWISSKAADQYEASLKKDENNPRAYIGMGQSDYYKPVMFGGGDKVEEYLMKALSLSAQTKENGPSWGRNTAYYILASYYKREDQLDQAKMYCMKGLNEFPKDFQLNQLKQSLTAK